MEYFDPGIAFVMVGSCNAMLSTRSIIRHIMDDQYNGFLSILRATRFGKATMGFYFIL